MKSKPELNCSCDEEKSIMTGCSLLKVIYHFKKINTFPLVILIVHLIKKFHYDFLISIAKNLVVLNHEVYCPMIN